MSATRTEILPSAAFTASGASSWFSIATARDVIVGVDITAGSGTPTLDLWLQASDDGGTTAYDYPVDISLKSSATATENTASTTTRSIVDNYSGTAASQYIGIYKNIATDRVRLKWIISGGTPSVTLSASMVAK